MNTYHIEQFNRLSVDDRDTLLDFLANLTEGDLRDIGRGMAMDHHDIRRLIDAHSRFTEEEEIPT